MVKKHFVTFFSPGTFVAETTTREIESWDVGVAIEMASSIVERYNATPYGFRFSTRGREDDELDSKLIASSSMYYIGGKVETLEEIKAQGEESNRILIANMEDNGCERVWTSTTGWSCTQPLNDGDVVLSLENLEIAEQ